MTTSDREGDLWDDLIAERMIGVERAAEAAHLRRTLTQVRDGIVRVRGYAIEHRDRDLTGRVDALLDLIDAARLAE